MIKKLILSLTAVSALVCTSVYAAGYKPADLKNLGNAILGKGEVTAEMDLTGDKIVDVFDLVAMRKYFTSTGEFTETTVPATEDYVKYTGRNYYD
ncbi:MAG: hypothetical protein NC040_08655, partial [Muribaculaceae bacterium]|nr:hypothetical protein [Muribaculaceae bacterium]